MSGLYTSCVQFKIYPMDNIQELIAIAKKENKKTLDLIGVGLESIPPEIFEIESLVTLRLRGNRIKIIPNEIEQLINLKELNIIDNQIATLPSALFRLPNLQIILGRKNNLTEIPKSVRLSSSLRTLNLAENKIKKIPSEIGKVKMLAALSLKKNLVTTIPFEFSKLENLRTFSIDSEKMIYPEPSIVKQGLMRIMIFLIVNNAEKGSKGFFFNIPKEMRTAVKQYLVYFQEYVEVSKGKKITFEVTTSDDGLYIQTSESDNIQEVNEYFNEYLGFVKSNIDDLNPDIEVSLPETKKELFVLELKQQINHLKQQIEFKNFQVKFLEQKVGEFHNLLLLKSSNPVPVLVQNISNSNSKIDSQISTNVTFNLSQEVTELQNEVLKLKNDYESILPTSISKELQQLDDELLEVEIVDEKVSTKKPFNRLKRIFDQLTDKESNLSKAVEKSKELKEKLQDLGKKYNKVSGWVGLPSIPELLLEL
ncbi:leucine-rich repeat domain-containing protein [Flavobacterium sp. NG2]|uniref:leucine-rich repeat domain-containing protein n=1 Tax=Flavobacterium sp. NG2 TaxID=3097547 RepID=UPI002A8159B0|nr:leucine-rich repeat domain-containing protein [Flavobacterium sp. NG2]WPR71490.1 leucine-rich repeat domain-containing protein [Flavobacterium sp. NG2]